jgi:hypothetical protein
MGGQPMKMNDWQTQEYFDLIDKYPPFDECEDYYDFCDHVLALCKDHRIRLDEDSELFDADIDVLVRVLLALPDGWEGKQ